MERLAPTWPAGATYGDWIPVDVALDYDLMGSVGCRWVTGEAIKNGREPSIRFANSWETVARMGSVTHIAVDRLHSIYQAGYDDHLIHVPTMKERVAELMESNDMWGSF